MNHAGRSRRMKSLARCPCGAEPGLCDIWQGAKPGPYQVQCGFCGRRGPVKQNAGEAVSAWNSDREAETPQLGAVCRIVFLYGKENSRDSALYREASEELDRIGLIPT